MSAVPRPVRRLLRPLGAMVVILALGYGVWWVLAWRALPDYDGTVPAALGWPAPLVAAAKPADSAPLVFTVKPEPKALTPDFLPAGQPAVFAFFAWDSRSGASTATVSWSLAGKPLPSMPHAPVTAAASAPGWGFLKLIPPGSSLKPGLYEVEIVLGERRLAGSFLGATEAEAIIAQPAPEASEVKISRGVLCSEIRPDGNPGKRLERFPLPTARVYYAFRYDQAEPGLALLVTWELNGQPVPRSEREVVLPSASGWAHAWLQAEPPGLPPGQLRATLTYVGDSTPLTSMVLPVP